MQAILATSYDGIYQGLATWHGLAVLGAATSAAIGSSERTWRAIAGVVFASLICVFALPPILIVAYVSIDGGSPGLEWIGMMLLAAVSGGAAASALFYCIRRVKLSRHTK